MKNKYSAVANHVFGGGMLVGFKKAGVKVLADLETFGIGVDTVRLNYPDVDVRHDPEAQSWKVNDFKDVDIVFGNPRCTAFSTLTVGLDHRHGSCGLATLDIRQSFSLVKACEPKIFCLESVQGAATTGKDLLQKLGDELPKSYRFAIVFINNSSFGVPQHRKRLFIVGYRDCNYGPRPPKRLEKTVLSRDVIRDLETIEAGGFRGKSLDWVPFVERDDKIIANHVVYSAIYGKDHDANCEKILPGCTLYTVDPRDLTSVLRKKREAGISLSFHVARRLSYDQPSPLIYAASGNWLHPTLPRSITIREAARLMCVPDDYWYVGYNQYAQVGNGVAPSTSKWIASTLIEALDGEHEDVQYLWNGKKNDVEESSSKGERWKRFEFTKLDPLDLKTLLESQRDFVRKEMSWTETAYGKKMHEASIKRADERKQRNQRGLLKNKRDSVFNDDHGTVEVT